MRCWLICKILSRFNHSVLKYVSELVQTATKQTYINKFYSLETVKTALVVNIK